MLKKKRSDLDALSEKFAINFRAITSVCLKNNLGFFQRLSHRFNKKQLESLTSLIANNLELVLRSAISSCQ